MSIYCCTAQTRAVRLMDPLATSQHVTALVSAKSPCCFVKEHLCCHCLCSCWAGPRGCATLSLCSIYLDVIVLALHLEQSVNLQLRNSCRRPRDCITYQGEEWLVNILQWAANSVTCSKYPSTLCCGAAISTQWFKYLCREASILEFFFLPFSYKVRVLPCCIFGSSWITFMEDSSKISTTF